MKPLGIDLAKLIKGDPFPVDHVPDCPGALLRVTRHDYDQLVKGGERIRTDRNYIPAQGYGSARVACSNLVAEIPDTASGQRLFYGLCNSCSSLEEDNRNTLRERAKVAGK